MNREHGFSLIEMLIAAAIALAVLAGTFQAFNDGLGLSEKTVQITDLEQNLRAGLNFMVRDFINAGWGIPIGGIPIPSGDGADEVVRPGPPEKNYTFGDSESIAAINPGSGLGSQGSGRATDIVNILYADSLLPLNRKPLDSIGENGASIVVNGVTPITGVANEIRAGDLIAFSNALGSTLQCVTRVSGQTIYFDSGDPLNLNQPAASQGSIMQIQSGGEFPPTTATRVYVVTYYLDYATDPETPRLIRQINNRAGDVVGLVLEDLQLSYDLVDGDTNPTNVKTPVDPNSPNQIRKVNILLGGRSSSPIRNTQEFLRRNLTTQVSLRSMSFVDRYR
jgi:prepilin-type N-terminal cleavage/methylation domain-containing protein